MLIKIINPVSRTIATVFFLVLFSGLVFSAAAQAADPTTIKLTAVGQVVEVKGTVKAVGLDNKVRVLKSNSPIFQKDTITTGKDSYAGVRFTDGTLGVLRPDTEAKINTYEFTFTKDANAAASPKNHFKIKLGKGGMDLNAGRISRGNSDAFEVSTPAGKIHLSSPKANIMYKQKDGLAFKGTGVIRNAKGIRDILKEGYAFVRNNNFLPTLVDQAPVFLGGADQVISTQILQQEVTQYGESSSYEETATYEEATSEEAVSQEDASDETAADDSSDQGAAPSSNEGAAEPQGGNEGAADTTPAKDEGASGSGGGSDAGATDSSGGSDEGAADDSSGGGDEGAADDSSGGDDSADSGGGDEGGGDSGGGDEGGGGGDE